MLWKCILRVKSRWKSSSVWECLRETESGWQGVRQRELIVIIVMKVTLHINPTTGRRVSTFFFWSHLIRGYVLSLAYFHLRLLLRICRRGPKDVSYWLLDSTSPHVNIEASSGIIFSKVYIFMLPQTYRHLVKVHFNCPIHLYPSC